MKALYSSIRNSFSRAVENVMGNAVASPVVSMWADRDYFKKVNELCPQNVFFKVDENLVAVDENGEKIESLYNCLEFSNKFIPVIYPENKESARKISKFLFENNLGDVCICVPYENISLKSVCSADLPMVRGMVDARKISKDTDLIKFAGDVWESGCTSVLIGRDLCTRENVYLLQHRMLQVIVKVGGEFIPEAVLDGVNGILTDDVSGAYSVLEKLPKGSRTRPFQLYGHKGFQNDGEFPENSVKAVAKSGELNLDGSEIDIKLTSDGVPMVLHNPTSKDFLTGNPLPIEEISYDDLSGRERVHFKGEKIDTLDSMLDTVKSYPKMQLLIEWKSTEKYCHVELMTEKIRNLVEKKDMEGQCSAIMGDMSPGMKYIRKTFPRLPRFMSVWEKTVPPYSKEDVEAMLYRFAYRMWEADAIPLVEDVMVDRFSHEFARLRYMTFMPWTRSWSGCPSTWEKDGELCDRNVASGYIGWIGDHANRFLYIPYELDIIDGKVLAIMRDGSKEDISDSVYKVELDSNYYAYAKEYKLHFGDSITMLTPAVRKEKV